MEMKNKCVVTNECFGFVLLESVFPKEMERIQSLFLQVCILLVGIFCSE